MNKLVYIFVPNEFVIGQVFLKLLITRLAVAMVNKTVCNYVFFGAIFHFEVTHANIKVQIPLFTVVTYSAETIICGVYNYLSKGHQINSRLFGSEHGFISP
jgi:hypothetical protein